MRITVQSGAKKKRRTTCDMMRRAQKKTRKIRLPPATSARISAESSTLKETINLKADDSHMDKSLQNKIIGRPNDFHLISVKME